MGDMNEYTEDTLRATVQAAELAIRDSEERGRLLAEMWQGLGLAADAGELLFQAPERVEVLREVLQARRQPGAQWDLREFLVSAYFSLHGRLDEDVIGVYKDVLQTQDGKRKALLDELKALTAELKVYSVIQSQINAALSAKQGIRIDAGGIDLVDPTLYGYAVGDPRWKDSPEYALLSNLDTFSGKLSIKDFLSGSPKQSGELKGLSDEYPFEKDNNPVGNFATTVSDRSRPLNDKVNEKTTLLNDTSSRYNSAVEALNRFIQKYDSVLRDILSAI